MNSNKVESVSIITPSFQQRSFLEETLHSVVGQRGDFDLDYIVVDGGSTDGSVELIQKFERRLQIGEIKPACRCMRFRWLSEKDSGQASAINKGFRLATGDVFAWLNSDDVYAGDQAIAKCMRCFRRHADSRFLYGKGFGIDREGVIQCQETYVTDSTIEDLPEIDMILQPAAFWRREVYETIGPLDESLHHVLDWEYWLRCRKHFRLEFLDEFLACKRRRETTAMTSGDIARRREIAHLLLTAGNFTQRAIQRHLVESTVASLPNPPAEGKMMRSCLSAGRYVGRRIRHMTKSSAASIHGGLLSCAKKFTRSSRFSASLGVYRLSSLFRGKTRTRLVKWAYHLEKRNVLALRDWILLDPTACDTAVSKILEWVGSVLHNVQGDASKDTMLGLLRSVESVLVNPAKQSAVDESDDTRRWAELCSQATREQDVPAVQQSVETDDADADDPLRGGLCSCAAAEANLSSQPQTRSAQQLAVLSVDAIGSQSTNGLAQEAQRFQPSPRDVYLASYPRSGNTWLRAVIAEIMFGESGNSLSDLDYFVPDIYQLPPVDDLRPADWHVVKTHEAYQHNNRNNFKRVIYILRDPRDVVCSYYRYVTTLKQYGASFDQFLADWLAGRIWPGLWREHVMSWAGSWHGMPQTTIKIVRYEDLLSDLENSISAIGEFLGYSLEPSQLNTVIRRTMPDEMRRKESAGMRTSERADGVPYFVGQAKANVWREALTDRQQSLIADHLGDCMKRFGYECQKQFQNRKARGTF